jgi:hypothetical protein
MLLRAGQFGHGGVVRLNIFEPHGPGIARNVVGARENDDDFGMKIDHILAEAHQHLRRGLAADAAVDVGLAGKIFVEMPDVGDGVAEEDDAILAGGGRFERGVGVAVARQLAEIIGEDGDAREARYWSRPAKPVEGMAGAAGSCASAEMLRRTTEKNRAADSRDIMLTVLNRF